MNGYDKLGHMKEKVGGPDMSKVCARDLGYYR